MQKSALERVRIALYLQREATRPELAELTGLSLVSCNQAMAELCRRGEANAIGLQASGGGRPVQAYRYNVDFSHGIYIRMQRQGALIVGTLELCNMSGNITSIQHTEFAYLRSESLDEWLDKATRKHKLSGIALETAEDILPSALILHLEARYRCPVLLLNTADALAARQDDELTLYFTPGEAPVCSLWRNGRAQHTGELSLLPLPTTWETLDYSDHTLVEEMVARLLVILTCTLAPKSIVLHAPFWTNRLTQRILFNASSKLHQDSISLQFCHISPGTASARLRAYAAFCFINN